MNNTEIQEQIDKLKDDVKEIMWQPIETAPTDRPFLAAQYAPTSWSYMPVYIDPRKFHNERHKELQLRYCRYWTEAPEPPKENKYD